LRFGAEPLVAAGDGRRGAEGLDRRQPAVELLEQDRLLHVRPARPAVLLRDRHAQPPELGALAIQRRGVVFLAGIYERLALLARRALPGAEVADRVPEVALLVGEGHAWRNLRSGNRPAVTPLRRTAGAPPATTLVTQSRWMRWMG